MRIQCSDLYVKNELMTKGQGALSHNVLLACFVILIFIDPTLLKNQIKGSIHWPNRLQQLITNQLLWPTELYGQIHLIL